MPGKPLLDLLTECISRIPLKSQPYALCLASDLTFGTSYARLCVPNTCFGDCGLHERAFSCCSVALFHGSVLVLQGLLRLAPVTGSSQTRLSCRSPRSTLSFPWVNCLALPLPCLLFLAHTCCPGWAMVLEFRLHALSLSSLNLILKLLLLGLQVPGYKRSS